MTTNFELPLQDGQAGLRVLTTTDVHGHLMPYNYHTDRPEDLMGLARTAHLIRKCQTVAQPNLLLDNGDFLQGTLLSEIVAGWGGSGTSHDNPIIAAMNALNYDAASLGNHEFNFGLDYLRSAIEAAKFPIVSANVLDATQHPASPLVPPWTLLERTLDVAGLGLRQIRIGIIGFTPPQVAQWDAFNLQGNIQTLGIIDAAKAALPALKAAGADIVIALCHGGLGSADDDALSENAALPLAELSGIDVVVMGHTHEIFPDPHITRHPGIDPDHSSLHGKPAINAGANGANLGVIDLALRYHGQDWSIAAHNSRNLPIYARDSHGSVRALVPAEPLIEAIAQEAHLATLTHIRKPIGHSATPLQSYFAHIAPDPTIRVVAEAQRRIVAQALHGTQWQHLPILSAAAPFKAGGRAGPNHFVDIPAGPIAINNISELYLYPNSICAQKLTGRQVREWLEQSASAFLTITPGDRRQPLLNPDVPSYNFDVIDGVTYEFDLTNPPRFDPAGHEINPNASRIRNLRFDGHELTDDQIFIIATNSFRAGGGGNFQAAKSAETVLGGVGQPRQAILQMFQQHVPVEIPDTPIWRFCPVPGATAVFQTGPRAPLFQQMLMRTPVLGFADDPSGFVICEIDLDCPPRS